MPLLYTTVWAGDGLASLSWMNGCWVSETETSRSDHWWMPGHGGTMIGIQRDVANDTTQFVEFVQINERDGRIVYDVSPSGQTRTEFALIEQGAQRVVFEKPDHDYPQRIMYESEGDVLTARIEGNVDGEFRSSEWRWQRAECL